MCYSNRTCQENRARNNLSRLIIRILTEIVIINMTVLFGITVRTVDHADQRKHMAGMPCPDHQ